MELRAVLKASLIALSLSLVSLPAHAISRYNSTSMSCAGVKATVQAEGAVVLRWRTTRAPGIQRYGRFVADDRFCGTGERAETSFIPSADHESCGVYECQRYDADEDDFFFFFWLRRR